MVLLDVEVLLGMLGMQPGLEWLGIVVTSTRPWRAREVEAVVLLDAVAILAIPGMQLGLEWLGIVVISTSEGEACCQGMQRGLEALRWRPTS